MRDGKRGDLIGSILPEQIGVNNKLTDKLTDTGFSFQYPVEAV